MSAVDLDLDAIEMRVNVAVPDEWYQDSVCYEDMVADLRALIAHARELKAREDRVRAVIADQPRRHGDAPCSDACVQYVCNDVLGVLA